MWWSGISRDLLVLCDFQHSIDLGEVLLLTQTHRNCDDGQNVDIRISHCWLPIAGLYYRPYTDETSVFRLEIVSVYGSPMRQVL